METVQVRKTIENILADFSSELTNIKEAYDSYVTSDLRSNAEAFEKLYAAVEGFISGAQLEFIFEMFETTYNKNGIPEEISINRSVVWGRFAALVRTMAKIMTGLGTDHEELRRLASHMISMRGPGYQALGILCDYYQGRGQDLIVMSDEWDVECYEPLPEACPMNPRPYYRTTRYS